MNITLTVRYLVEFAMLIPAAALAIMPVYYSRKVNKPFMYGLLSILLTAAIAGGTVLCTAFGRTSNTIIFPSMIVFFFAYSFCFDLSIPKKIFAFSNAVLLCGFSTTYTTFLTAPLELGNTENVLEVSSGLICLGVTLVIGGAFTRALIVRFPELFENDMLDSTWTVLMIAPIVTAAAVIWMNPIYAENVMTGRLRMICLVVLPSIPITAFFMYHILWWLSKKMTETAKLQQGYDLLKMEEKQYLKTRRYLQETSNIRHDFRQHILLINELAQSGDIEKLKEYIYPIVETVNRTHKTICKNHAVDVIAGHYIEIAKSQGVEVNWSVDVGETLPIEEADMCAVLGNLVENAVQAAAQLEGDDRLVNVRIGLQSPKTIVISIYNAYRGTIILDKNGMPVTDKKGHGVGLRSVKNIVDKYSGSMVIETHSRLFNVSILMYELDE